HHIGKRDFLGFLVYNCNGGLRPSMPPDRFQLQTGPAIPARDALQELLELLLRRFHPPRRVRHPHTVNAHPASDGAPASMEGETDGDRHACTGEFCSSLPHRQSNYGAAVRPWVRRDMVCGTPGVV